MVDIEIRPVVHDYHLLVHKCPHCRRRTQACLPLGVPKTSTGPKLQAAIGVLSGRYRLSRNEVREACKSLFGVPLSVGTVQNTCERVSAAVAEPVAEVVPEVVPEVVRALPVLPRAQPFALQGFARCALAGCGPPSPASRPPSASTTSAAGRLSCA